MKLTKTSKMPCKSWSLNALDTCAGSIDPETGLLVPACQGCYATTGFYQMKTVRKPRDFNKSDWKRIDWVSDMVAAIGKDKYFRWFDSGDMYSIKLARKILEVMKATPNCNHWLPTRMHKFMKFRHCITAMNALPNVVVRLSSDSINGETIDGDYTSTIIPQDTVEVGGYCRECYTDLVDGSGCECGGETVTMSTVCLAYQRGGKCGDCRACWSKDIPLIKYRQHGKKMAKVNLQLVG